MYWIDAKYLGMLSTRIPLFTVKSNNPYLANSRCPICGDSKKNLYKKRAYYFQQKDKILLKCHNCGATRSVSSLLKELDPTLKKEYDLEVFAETRANAPVEAKKEIVHEYLTPGNYNAPLKKLKKISQLPVGHPARDYVNQRGIPPSQHFRLYYAPKFCAWTNSIIPDKFDLSKGDEPRLVLPFFDTEGNMFGYSGRSFKPDTKLRYATIMTRGDHVKVFGLDQVDFSKTVYMVEGPIDSLFLPNCLAMAGADVTLDFLDKDKSVIVFDNEPRNKDIVKRMKKAVKKGYTICFWPETIEQKDVNDMVKSGLSAQQVVRIIDANSHNDLEAELKMMNWSKV
jgi:hypothetical protein